MRKLDLDPVVGTDRRQGGYAHQQVPDVANAGVGHQSLEVALGEGNQVPKDHCQGGQDDDDELPVPDSRHQRFDEKSEYQGEGRGLGATARYPVMGMGAPSYASGAHMWNGTEATLNPRPAMMSTRPISTPGLRSGLADSAWLMPSNRVCSQETEDLADAVKHQGRREGAQQYVLGASLVGLWVVPIEGDQNVRTEAEQLQRDVGGQQLTRRRPSASCPQS